MSKRGASHIEMILSFVLFVAAIGFALYFFSPFNSTRLAETTLNYGFREIAQNVSVDIDSYSLIVNGSGLDGSVLAIRVSDLGRNPRLQPRVEHETHGEIPSRRGISENTVVYIANPGWSDLDFATVKFSEDYSGNGDVFLTPAVDENFYELVFSDSRTVVSEERIQELADTYLSDYLGLKESFNLPSRVNFAFSLAFDNGERIDAGREVPDGLEIFSETERKEILRSNGDSEFADLRVQVW